MLNFLFPRFCVTCIRVLLKQEELLCVYCINELPVTHFHKYNAEVVLNLFYGLLPVYQATSLLYFIKDGISQSLIHKLKYKGQQNIGSYFGNWLGSELKQIASYRDIDVVIAVPLHKKRLRARGYNQVANFAKQISEQLGAVYCEDGLIKVSNLRSQVGLGRWSRFKNQNVFQLGNSQMLKGKHVLLVDDTITTGATLIECGKELLKAPIKKLSIASLAIG